MQNDLEWLLVIFSVKAFYKRTTETEPYTRLGAKRDPRKDRIKKKQVKMLVFAEKNGNATVCITVLLQEILLQQMEEQCIAFCV